MAVDSRQNQSWFGKHGKVSFITHSFALSKATLVTFISVADGSFSVKEVNRAIFVR